MPLAWCLLLGIQLQEALWPKDWHTCHLCNCALFLCAGKKSGTSICGSFCYSLDKAKWSQSRSCLKTHEHDFNYNFFYRVRVDRAVGMTNERDKIMRMVLALPALCFGVGWLLVVGPTLFTEGESAAGIEARGGEEVMNLEQVFREGERWWIWSRYLGSGRWRGDLCYNCCYKALKSTCWSAEFFKMFSRFCSSFSISTLQSNHWAAPSPRQEEAAPTVLQELLWFLFLPRSFGPSKRTGKWGWCLATENTSELSLSACIQMLRKSGWKNKIKWPTKASSQEYNIPWYPLHSFLKHSSCLCWSESNQTQGWKMQLSSCDVAGKNLLNGFAHFSPKIWVKVQVSSYFGASFFGGKAAV